MFLFLGVVSSYRRNFFIFYGNLFSSYEYFSFSLYCSISCFHKVFASALQVFPLFAFPFFGNGSSYRQNLLIFYGNYCSSYCSSSLYCSASCFHNILASALLPFPSFGFPFLGHGFSYRQNFFIFCGNSSHLSFGLDLH